MPALCGDAACFLRRLCLCAHSEPKRKRPRPIPNESDCEVDEASVVPQSVLHSFPTCDATVNNLRSSSSPRRLDAQDGRRDATSHDQVPPAGKRQFILSPEDLAGVNYSWLGQKGKKFSFLKFPSLIWQAVKRDKMLYMATRANVEAAMKSWLRHAKERTMRVLPNNQTDSSC